MNCHLYKEHLLKKATVVALCHDVPDCDKLSKFGWAATTVLEDEGGEPVPWCCTCVANIVPLLQGKRIVFFPRQDAMGRVTLIDVVCKLIDHIIDFRVVNVPVGESITQFLETITTSRDASQALEKLVGQAVTFTSAASYLVGVDLNEIGKEIESCQDLWGMEKEYDQLVAKFRQIQRHQSLRRAKHVLDGRRTSPPL